MSCRKGCGNDAAKIELIVKDLIRQMIEKGQLQEGLVDCTDTRLWRNARVVTCDILKEAFCKMMDDGDLCLVLPERVYINETGNVCLMMSDGTSLCSATSLPDTKVTRLHLDGMTIRITMSDGSDVGSVDLSDVLLTAQQQDDGTVVISQRGRPSITIPANKVRAEKSHDGTVSITNQDGSVVTVDPVRQGDQGKSAYQVWLDQGHHGSEDDFLTWLRNDENKVAYTDAFGDPVLTAF